jgi:serine/threonine-protein kinase
MENAVVAGRFKLERLLGRGGMGSVWQAVHLGLDIPCAVKFIEGEFAALAEAHIRFEREAKAAAQLRSPHVVQILDHGVWEGRPYIAMELLDGEDLGKRLMRVGRLHPAELNTVLSQVCRALGKAHASGIVHRDLKPDNIFLVRDDDREIAKVLDFGIAKSKSSDLLTGSNTRTGAMLGTPYYMSPEQAQGTKAVDSRSDLWSLAVIAYQCITGKLPFESEALGDLLIKIIVSPIPVPSSVAQVPPGFDAWFARAASRDPNQRFQSPKEFSDALALAVGSSALTDVMDHRALQAALEQRNNNHNQTQPHNPAAPFAQSTRDDNSAPMMEYQYPPPQQTPRPFGMTPASAMAQSIATDPAFHKPVTATTGAPIARTYSGMMENAVVPRKAPSKMPVLFAAAGITLVVGAAAIFGAVKLHGKSSSASGGDTTAAVTTAAPTAPGVEPPVATVAAQPTVTAPASAAVATTPTPPPEASAKTAAVAPTTKPAEVHRDHSTTTTTTTPTSTPKPRATGGQAAAVEKMGF